MRLQRLQWPQHYLLVEGVSNQHVPVVENAQTECLASRMHPKVSLETKRINGRNRCLNGVER